MLKSMTGFGRCEMATDEYKISVEMKAVNHRYLDLSIKMPKKFNYFEAAIRAQLKKYIQRGKVDVFISYEVASLSSAFALASSRTRSVLSCITPLVYSRQFAYCFRSSVSVTDLPVV